MARLKPELQALEAQLQQAGRQAEQAKAAQQQADRQARRELERARHEADERKLHIQVSTHALHFPIALPLSSVTSTYCLG